jgi:hypothetical protein
MEEVKAKSVIDDIIDTEKEFLVCRLQKRNRRKKMCVCRLKINVVIMG